MGFNSAVAAVASSSGRFTRLICQTEEESGISVKQMKSQFAGTTRGVSNLSFLPKIAV
jgi:hypothetical protein